MIRVIACALFLFTAAVAGEVSAQTAIYRIAFNTAENQKTDDYDIYVMGLDGSGRTNVTRNPDVAWTYYTYGGRMFFVSDRSACKRCYFLYESDSEGKNVRRVSNLQLEDSWMGSRNAGKEMIVSARVGTSVRFQLFILDLSTGRYRQLTNEPAAAYRDPTFSPDGKKIAYVYKKNRTDRAEIAELYVMNADGSNRKKLTTYPADDPLSKDPGYKTGPPHWNAKYKFITYQSEQKGSSGVYAVTPDGKKNWKIETGGHPAGWHDWSPDGQWLTFDARDEASGRYDIYLMNYLTKDVKKITGDSPMKYHQAPVFIDIR